ncbi:alpha/beta fold hydrolase [Agitococcus lubricus]|uniref:Pimeloyl-ACP methyl ester carboxylesterase n=1 Tax=Agitococcus lubricus TaxID=1077255 RepID=A0A2T5J2Y9_9GAMM|nr:alpha/beta hydrolase [Agitococcus lubricus]PTQ90987.1 pimeloyl-ACP methyl ester carboxylesterase [Agitococcus lubricus]
MATLPASVLAWQNRGHYCQLAGLDIFYRDIGPRQSDAVLLLHGFPSSAYDWHAVLPLLGEDKRIIVFDFVGFGLSAKPKDYSYSLFEQADIVEMLLRYLQVKRVKLLAHDMGTTVACELIARRERKLLSFSILSLLLMNGSVHIELAQLTPSQQLLRSPLASMAARLSSKWLFKAQLRRILAKPVPETELNAMWSLLSYKQGHHRLSQTVSYIDERYRFAHRWLPPLTRLEIPVLILWGQQDPVAVAAIAKKLATQIPTAKLQWLPRLGHYPQLEDPVAVADVMNLFLA